MAHTKKGRKVALLAGLALLVLSVAVVWSYWGEIRFALNFERLAKNAQGFTEYRHRQTGIVFVGLPGGEFEMGAPRTESLPGFSFEEDEGPVHKVALSPFLIAKYEVSQTKPPRLMHPSIGQVRFRGDAREA